MSVLGIDIGTSFSVLATVGKGVVTVIRNDVSESLTPCLVGFTSKERLIGEAAQAQIKSNAKNTSRYLKQLMGRVATDSELDREREFSLCPLVEAPGESGLVGCQVNYKGETRVFNSTRLMAMLLTKLRQTAEKSTGMPVHDVVIGVPGWYTDINRKAVLDAAKIAGLNCLRVMNEHAATALDYGIYRSSTFHEKEASRVMFVGVGHGSTSVSIVEFKKGELRVLAVENDRALGGRDMDRTIICHFARQFQQQYKDNPQFKNSPCDPLANQKAVLKMEEQATRLKKVLSANLDAPFGVECLLGDFDFQAVLSRDEFEQMCVPLKERLEHILSTALQNSGLRPEDIHFAEIVGGCTRIPWVQRTITESLGNRLPLSKTLNLDECVARGCALQAAMLNPRYRVREFNVVDCSFHPVVISFQSSGQSAVIDGAENHNTEVPPSGGHRRQALLFESGAALPTRKFVTFQRSQSFDIQAAYGKPELLPPGTSAHLGRYCVHLPESDGADKKVKVKARLTLHGTFDIECAHLITEEEVEEKVKETRPKPQPQPHGDVDMAPTAEGEAQTPADAPTEAPVEEFETVEVIKKRMKSKKTELAVTVDDRPGWLTEKQTEAFHQSELEMANDDRMEQETREKMNEVEGYIYELRNRLQESLADYALKAEKEHALKVLEDAENWLYDNYDVAKSVYAAKLAELQTIGNPINNRKVMREKLKEAADHVQGLIMDQRALCSSPDEKYAHIGIEKRTPVLQRIAEVEAWLHAMMQTENVRPLHENVGITAEAVMEQGNTLVSMANQVFSEPKPAPPPKADPKPEANTAAPSETDVSMDGTQ